MSVTRAILEDAALVWDYDSPVRKGGAANVGTRAGPRVPGAVLEVDDLLLRAFDKKEGHTERYRRAVERVVVEGAGPRDAWVYRVTERYRSLSADVWPRRAYLDVILRGARALDLEEAHIDMLSRTPTLD